MRRGWVYLALASVAVGAAVAARRARLAKAARLGVLNDQFHAAYDRVRSASASSAPVLVLFGDALVLYEGERTLDFVASAPNTELLKAAAHVPAGIFALLLERVDRPLDPATRLRLAAFRDADDHSRGELARLAEASHADVEHVLDASRRFIDQALAQGRVGAGELSSYAAEMGPLLLRLIEQATRLELDALHAGVESALQQLRAEQRDALEVVVAGAHQARARSLGLQYFQKRFAEQQGEERRVAYAESAADPAAARELIGTRRLDRAIGAAFFGDPKRLQRDVLGDAAAELLARSELEPLA